MITVLVHGLVVVGLDQLSKMLVLSHLRGNRRIALGSYVQVRCVINPGGLFGRAPGLRAALGLWVLAVIAGLLLVTHASSFQSHVTQIALGWMLGGATGNLIDRMGRGVVVDFVDCRVWPVFNLADAAMVLGMLLAFGCRF